MGGANPTVSVANITVVNATHSQVDAAAITTAALGNVVLNSLDTAIMDVNSSRATLGASANRLEFASENILSISQNTAARSRRLCREDDRNRAHANNSMRQDGYARASKRFKIGGFVAA